MQVGGLWLEMIVRWLSWLRQWLRVGVVAVVESRDG